MMSTNPIHYMNQEQVARLRENVVYTDIPIPINPEEEFDNEVLIEWYKEQKNQGLAER